MLYEDSMLASLVSGKWKEGKGKNEIFIDRDGGRFKYVLDYLRSDRVYISDLSTQSAVNDELEYFGINADISKVFVMDDFVTIDVLTKEIKASKEEILQKKKKIAAIKESYRLLDQFSRRAESQGLFLRHSIEIDVDKELLTECLLSRGLYVVGYNIETARHHTADICAIGVKDSYISNA